MSSVIKNIKICPHESIENEYVVRIIFECNHCHSIWHVDHIDKKEADLFYAKVKSGEPFIEAVCIKCNHIINLN